MEIIRTIRHTDTDEIAGQVRVRDNRITLVDSEDRILYDSSLDVMFWSMVYDGRFIHGGTTKPNPEGG
jgi:hypothetical protein